MSELSATRTTSLTRVVDDDSDTPTLTLHVDTSVTLPNGAKMPRSFEFEISAPSAEQRAAYKKGAAVTVTIAPTPAPAAQG